MPRGPVLGPRGTFWPFACRRDRACGCLGEAMRTGRDDVGTAEVRPGRHRPLGAHRACARARLRRGHRAGRDLGPGSAGRGRARQGPRRPRLRGHRRVPGRRQRRRVRGPARRAGAHRRGRRPAGKHLLLEKPLATSEADADELVEAVTQARSRRSSSSPSSSRRVRAGCRRTRARLVGGPGLVVRVIPARVQPVQYPVAAGKGALWDIAPHVIALLWAALGPVTSVTADAARRRQPPVLHHQGGASSTVTVCRRRRGGRGFGRSCGEAPTVAAPPAADDPLPPLRTALAELAGNIRAGHRTRVT